MGIRVEEVSETRSRLLLRRRTCNHVGSICLGAQVTVMEVTMGMLVFRDLPMGLYQRLVNRVDLAERHFQSLSPEHIQYKDMKGSLELIRKEKELSPESSTP